MKAIQTLKHKGRELYTLGLKLIFIYAEYSEPTLFASLMNLCIAKVPELLSTHQNNNGGSLLKSPLNRNAKGFLSLTPAGEPLGAG